MLLKKNKEVNKKRSNLVENFSIKNLDLKDIDYSIETKKIFSNFNFSIKKESLFRLWRIRIRKTTLLNLLLNFKYPEKGKLLINERSIEEYDYENFLMKINYLQQDPSIFDGSFVENIALQEIYNTNIKKR